MEVHSRSHDAPTRKQLKSKISSYRSGLQSAKSDFRQARRRGERADLLETDGMLLGSSTRDQKRSLMDSSDRLSSSTETLKASKRVLEETHEVGTFLFSLSLSLSLSLCGCYKVQVIRLGSMHP
jgi:hypothetical protein